MARRQQDKHALGSEAVLTLRGDEGELPEWFELLWHEIALFEHTFSRFLPDSELNVVNQQAGLPVSVSPEFERLLRTALELSEETMGLFNPLVLPALQRAGYKGSWPTPHSLGAAPDYSQSHVVSAGEIEVENGLVRLPPNTALDFGGIGKGYLLDRLADVLVDSGCGDFWLSLGGDIVMQGYNEADEPWHVGIARADGEGVVTEAATVDGERLAIATSGTTKRRGPDWHHIIDPRTGRSAETDVLTATVCNESATKADVFAKCLVLLGASAAADLTWQYGLTKTILQVQNKDGTVRVQRKGI